MEVNTNAGNNKDTGRIENSSERNHCKENPRRENSQDHRVPEGFTVSMAVMDALPVAFFCGSAVLLSLRFPAVLFCMGALLVIAAGTMKVLWKFVIALGHRNVWFLNRQMRYLMPVGFLLIIISLIVNHDAWSLLAVGRAVISFPSVIFFICGAAGIVLMSVYAARLDGSDAHSNWIEQGTNAVAQLCFLLGIMFA